MNPLLEQFLSEARESLQSAGAKLMHLENEPDNAEVMVELFRLVHTLKGNSGLFDFPEMTRVLHAAEDLMDGVRGGKVTYSPTLADRLLDAMDFVGILCDEIETDGKGDPAHGAHSTQLAEKLRQLIGRGETTKQGERDAGTSFPTAEAVREEAEVERLSQLAALPEAVLMAAYRRGRQGKILHLLTYSPVEDCFFQGDDPFFQAQRTPGILWGGITARQPWPKLGELDAYRCLLDFHILSEADRGELNDHYRYVLDQLRITEVAPSACILPQGDPNGGPVYDDFVTEALDLLQRGDRQQLLITAESMLELSNPELWFSSALRWLLVVLEFADSDSDVLRAIIASLLTLTVPHFASPCTAQDECAGPAEGKTDTPLPADAWQLLPAEMRDDLTQIIAAQAEILALPDDEPWLCGRIKGVAATLGGCLQAGGKAGLLGQLAVVTEQAVATRSAHHLLRWLTLTFKDCISLAPEDSGEVPSAPRSDFRCEEGPAAADIALHSRSATSPGEGEIKFGRRAEDAVVGAKVLKVDQGKIDRLMNLIGEMVVAKNSLPYLAGRAETVFGVRELSREIKAQYSVINRIAEEMQHSIMQVRMMPVSFIFQRFPRLVRDISHRLAKEVNLVLEGEDTEADKNIIEALGDPLMHIVRNSLDHGIELPEVRRAAGKAPSGTLTIRARQESDRVLIEITDDGKGIDPESIKAKAFEKGIIDEEKRARMSDQEAVNLVFAAGFSTAEAVSDLSGRGVGMDVVRSAVEKVNGTLVLESTKGAGTRLRLSLPLSMAVTNAMIVESNERIFGVPIDVVVETVRVPRRAIRSIKKSFTTVLRGRIIPLKSLNALLGLSAPQQANDEDEVAVLVVNHLGEAVGIMVDNFRETVDIILKPMAGVLAGLAAYSGSALLGDGSVLMILNIKEIL